MLHNTPDSSNFEVIIMFPGRLDIYSLVIEVYLYYEVKSLRSLVCAMEIQSWQASRQLCKRGAFHSALLVKVAACNIY